MWGPKQEKERKPQVLHFYCWIFSMWVSEGIRKKKKWEAKWCMIKGKCRIPSTLNLCAFNWATAWCGKMVFILRNVKATILYKPVGKFTDSLWLKFTVHCPHPAVYNGVYSIYCDCSEFHADIELEGLLLQNVSHMENVEKMCTCKWLAANSQNLILGKNISYYFWNL